MNKLLVILLVISICGNCAGLFILYKYFGAKRVIQYAKNDTQKSQEAAEKYINLMDNIVPHKMIFIHHSVGQGMLDEGGLADSLIKNGILVKSATYGDDIGENTDIRDWVPKFRDNLKQIFEFKAHPNKYYSGQLSNEIVVFKSCFPNSDIASEGNPPGDPTSFEKTVTNYSAAFEQVGEELKKHQDKLFIFMTAPPLVPSTTTSENAARAREFNNWLTGDFIKGYKSETGLDNFEIFNLFAVLSDSDGYLKEEYRIGPQAPDDPHPNPAGSKAATAAFISFFEPVWKDWQEKHASN